LGTYILRRLLMSIPVLLAITIVVFLFLHLSPVDPIKVILGDTYDEERGRIVKQELGLDRSLPVQYGLWLGRVLQGNLGRSYVRFAPVSELIVQRLPLTVILACLALIASLMIAIPVGVISATRRGSFFDGISRVIAMLGISVPVFWLGILLIVLFSMKLRWLPPRGSLDAIASMILPAVTLGAANGALIARLTRSSLLEVLSEDYVRTARSKGLSEKVTIYKHALGNALLPVVTMIGIQFGYLLGGAVLTEIVFSMPGIGRLLVESIHNRDFPVVQGCILVVTSGFVFINLLVDILYSVIDPRIRYK
jgi:peptide/nickel transport system permease protein